MDTWIKFCLRFNALGYQCTISAEILISLSHKMEEIPILSHSIFLQSKLNSVSTCTHKKTHDSQMKSMLSNESKARRPRMFKYNCSISFTCLFNVQLGLTYFVIYSYIADYPNWHNSYILNPCDGERHKLDDF